MVNDKISSISAVIDKLDYVVQNNKNETDNEFDIFGKHVAVQLKKMSLYDAIMCQEQIQTIMRQKLLELLTRQSSCHTTLSSGISPIRHLLVQKLQKKNIGHPQFQIHHALEKNVERIRYNHLIYLLKVLMIF